MHSSTIGRELDQLPFWRMVATPTESLRFRAERMVSEIGSASVSATPTEALPGAGSAPGVTMPSYGLSVVGDHVAALRRRDRPVIARATAGSTVLDLRAVDPGDDASIVEALRAALGQPLR
jgi:L-seryl-tRNA(Ser) seleniumtransferase